MVVYLKEKFHPDAEALLRANATVVDNLDSPDVIDAVLVRRDKVPAEMINALPNLKAIGRHGAGYDGVDYAAAKARGAQIVYVPAGNSQSVAELIVCLALNLERRISEANAICRGEGFKCIAPPDFQGAELSGKVFGSIGMGNIAQRAAKIFANGFGMRTVGYDRHSTPEKAASLGFEKEESIAALLEASDVVNISVPLNDGTRNMISGELFNHFKPGAILINCARGGVVNEDDLYDALVTGKLKAAACDVFADEPPRPTNKLLNLPNFSATPHIGGNTEDAIRRTGVQLVENVLHVLRGEPAEGLVDMTR